MSIEKEVQAYTTSNGKVPFHNWLNGLKDETTRARINRRLDRLALGNYGDFKPVGEGVYEMRLQELDIVFILEKLITILFCYCLAAIKAHKPKISNWRNNTGMNLKIG